MANYMVCLSHFCELHGPSCLICTQITGDPDSMLLKNTSKLQTCASCKLTLPNDKMNIVTKKGKSTYYVSTQYPSLQKRYTSLTKLIMKSLSVETVSDYSNPLFIGDNINGFSLVKFFKIKDVHARGGERKYSLMVISDEELKIIKHFDIISMYLTEIIQSITLKVQKLLEKSTDNNENYLRRSLNKPKSLTDLTGDEKVFVKIHLGCVQLIKSLT